MENTPKTREVVRTYSVSISDDRIRELITWYSEMLQRTIEKIWNNITWEYRFPEIVRKKKGIKVKIGRKIRVPKIPSDKNFKKKLRDSLLTQCPYAKHWVDAVIRTAYSIIESWRKRYLKGKARKTMPRIKRRFARCKITLMRVDYERKIIRVTLRPGEYLEISWSNRWFINRVRGWSVGEIIIKDNRILIPFKRNEVEVIEDLVAWDSNELSLDGYTPSKGFIKVDLRYLQSIKITYEEKKAKAQSLKKRELFEKYSRRERNRERDFINKLAKQITILFPRALHIVEDLEKEDMVRRGEVDKARRKRNSRTPWKQIHEKLSEKAFVAKVSPKNTSRTSPQCGYIVKTQVGRIFKCKRCGFELVRQKLASLNIYLKYTRMWGFPHSNEPEQCYEGELWVGVTLNGWRPMIWAPMKGALRPMKPREEQLISLDINRNETQTPLSR